MHFTICLAIVAAAAVTSSLATPIAKDYVIHETRTLPSISRLRKRNAVDPSTIIPIRIGLKQRNLHQGHDWLMSVSDPTSRDYGKFWTAEDVVSAFSPHDDTVKSVTKWLVEAGNISHARIAHSDNKAWLAFDATVGEAETLLRTSYYYYEHRSSTASYLGCDAYYTPAAIQHHIDYITPGVKAIKVRRSISKRAGNKSKHKGPSKSGADSIVDRPGFVPPDVLSSAADCHYAITPECLRVLYNFTELEPGRAIHPSNSIGVFQEGDYFAQSDLDLFFHDFTTIPNGTTPLVHTIPGGRIPDEPEAGDESALDLQLIYPIVYPQTVTVFQTNPTHDPKNPGRATGIFNTFLDAIDGSYCTYCSHGQCGNDVGLDPQYSRTMSNVTDLSMLHCGLFRPTNVLSISYGEQEADLPAYYQLRQCSEFLKLGLQGISIFVASGDDGVGGYSGSNGQANGCMGAQGTIFSPTQPNSCPYVTNVGGTSLAPNASVHDRREVAALPRGSFSSGGGFSNLFAAPPYQRDALAAFFADHDPGYPSYDDPHDMDKGRGVYHRHGRGIPDVAAIADYAATIVGGEFVRQGGTSASAPVFAALMNRIVEERLGVGKGPVGFVNPVLYRHHREVLRDVVGGRNPGCGTEGFEAVEGWDPVTGLGTMDYGRMLELFLRLP